MWIKREDGSFGWDSGNHESRLGRVYLSKEKPSNPRRGLKRWQIVHAVHGTCMGVVKDKGEAQRWCRWWTKTQRALGLSTPGFRVNRITL